MAPSDIEPDRLARLRQIPADWAQPPQEMVASIPKAGVQLDYMGHADVTLALIDVDPDWYWTPGWDTPAGPVDPFAMGPQRMLATLHVCGKALPCVGTIEARKADQADSLKELIGDMLRNGAMRFGIGTALWSKSEGLSYDDAGHLAPSPVPAGELKRMLVARLGAMNVTDPKGVAAKAWAAVEPGAGPFTVEQQGDVLERAVRWVQSDG